MKEICYVNLTNGIEAIPKLPLGYRFIRIQSTLCEQKCWDQVVRDLDYDFLMQLAFGNHCLIYDYSARKNISRALFQGLEFIKYVLNRRWFKNDPRAYVKNMDVTPYFAQEYKKLSKTAKRKIDYFKKFLQTDKINVEGFCEHTNNDGNFSFYSSILQARKNT